mmetsp:Transcript_63578/g.87385  ORF Transcript_63578/g.87385 Transcript_63578/m.87385 type:complete len:346 (+) Transcript_63578:164-1201(+)
MSRRGLVSLLLAITTHGFLNTAQQNVLSTSRYKSVDSSFISSGWSRSGSSVIVNSGGSFGNAAARAAARARRRGGGSVPPQQEQGQHPSNNGQPQSHQRTRAAARRIGGSSPSQQGHGQRLSNNGQPQSHQRTRPSGGGRGSMPSSVSSSKRAGIPFMITLKMKKVLIEELRYSRRQVDNMSAQEATSIIGSRLHSCDIQNLYAHETRNSCAIFEEAIQEQQQQQRQERDRSFDGGSGSSLAPSSVSSSQRSRANSGHSSFGSSSSRSEWSRSGSSSVKDNSIYPSVNRRSSSLGRTNDAIARARSTSLGRTNDAAARAAARRGRGNVPSQPEQGQSPSNNGQWP